MKSNETMTQPTESEKVAISPDEVKQAAMMLAGVGENTWPHLTEDYRLYMMGAAHRHLAQTDHLREQLQLKESQVGKMKSLVWFMNENGDFRNGVTHDGLDEGAVTVERMIKQTLDGLATTPNYVKRVEELEFYKNQTEFWKLEPHDQKERAAFLQQLNKQV